MNEQSSINKKAWEYRAYEFWVNRDGLPQEKAAHILKDPKASLKKHLQHFGQIEGRTIANLCGSNGRKAVPLSLLGANVTVFDLSEENKRYALELANYANASIDYIVGDLYDIDLNTYSNHFDILYLEGGILHYFDDIHKLMTILFSLLKMDGKMILSDFHPIGRCIDSNSNYIPNYFNENLHSGDVPYKQFFSEKEQKHFPDVKVRSYTMGDIINAVIASGFTLQRYDEHRGWKNENIPWEFTILATR